MYFTSSNEIRIETSTHCNYSCIMCPRNLFEREKENMSSALFEQIIKKAKDEVGHLNTLTFSGFGEFSMDPNWKEKVKLASSSFKNVHILTNASLLTFSDIDYLLNYITDIRISVYGIDNNTYKSIHNNPEGVDYELVMSKILHIKNQKKASQKLLLNYLEINEELGLTENWIKKFKAIGDVIEVWKPHNWVDGKKYRPILNKRKSTCGRPFSGPIQVQVDGTVTVCCFDYNGKLEIGDLKKQSFQEIFSGKAFQEIKNIHKTDRADEITVCALCDQRENDDSRAKYLIYSSMGSNINRVKCTSTNYENLSF